jgi:putative ABC transport system ATP-binding protein
VNRPARIVLAGVSKHYATLAGTVRAVDGISLAIEPGSSVAITGPSGCGKSTLLGLVAGLETPGAGSVTVGDEEISRLPEKARAGLRRREIGLIFQADNLQPFLTALENVGLALALRGGGADGYGRCLAVLGELGLGDEAGKLPDQLSGGQRQRVAVARALVNDPAVILADEPTGSLDAGNSATIVDLLRGAQHATGATLVVVTHDPDVARRLDRIVSLLDGRVVGDSAPSEPRECGRVRA